MRFYKTPDKRVIINPFIFTAPPSGSYIISEDCEGTGTPSGWVNTGTVNWDYTAAPLAGSQSMRPNSGSSNAATYDFAAMSDFWFFVKWNKETQATSASNWLVYFQNASNTNVGRIQSNLNTSHQIAHGSASNLGATGIGNASIQSIWLHWVKGTGANGVLDLWIQTDGTENRPVSKYATISAGTATTDATRLGLASATGTAMVFDKIRLSASEIFSNPT